MAPALSQKERHHIFQETQPEGAPLVGNGRGRRVASDAADVTVEPPKNYAGRGPKMADPTRTIVAPSSTATSKSWDMPIDSSAMTTSGICAWAIR
jgi:hypothetical protein